MSRLWNWVRGGLVVAVVGAPLAYFGLGAIATYRVDDNLETAIPAETGPAAIARTYEKILTREIEHNNWQPSNPWFYPTAWTDDGHNFQLGVLHGVRRSLLEYATRTIRARTDAALDPDLQNALNQLQYPPNVWILDVTQGFGVSSVAQYKSALESLRVFEKKAQTPEAFGELRSDQLRRFLDALQIDIMAHVIRLQEAGNPGASVFNTEIDDLFYQTKGAGFVYAALAPALKSDFADVFEKKRLNDLWAQLEANLTMFARYNPPVILAGSPDGIILPNHLLIQGFYASRCAEIMIRIEEALRS